MSDWRHVPAGKIARQRRESVRLEPGTRYRTMGVRWYGKGAYDRGVVTTETVKAKSLYRAREGDLTFNRIDTQNGAFDVVSAELDGALATNEFPFYEVNKEEAEARFLLLNFQRSEVLRQIGAIRAGSEGRARWKEADFEAWMVPVPPLPVQRRIIEVIRAVDDQITALDAEADALARMHHATRERMLEDVQLKPLSDVCDLTARLVDPRLEEHADLIHVGVETITKGTGEIVGAVTAREDEIISGKYLFGEGDVIYSKIRPALRKVAVPGFSGLCSADAYPLTPKDGIPATLLREALLQERVVELAVSMAGRTKMPKVNRKQLFSIQVAIPRPESRAFVDATLSAPREQRKAVLVEVACLRRVRTGLLSGLLDRTIGIESAELKV